jgi:GAF domain-containing protein
MKRAGPDHKREDQIIRAKADELLMKYAYLDDGEPVFPGKRGHIYLDRDDWCWALIAERAEIPWSCRTLEDAKRDPRLEVMVDTDQEGIFRIRDPEADLKDIALKLVKCSRKRRVSEEVRARLKRVGGGHRFSGDNGAGKSFPALEPTIACWPDV